MLDLNGSFSQLGNENLIVNFLEESDNSPNSTSTKIDSDIGPIKVYKQKNSGLSAGAIVAIVVSCVAAVLMAAIAAVLLRRVPKGKIENESSVNSTNVKNITI